MRVEHGRRRTRSVLMKEEEPPRRDLGSLDQDSMAVPVEEHRSERMAVLRVPPRRLRMDPELLETKRTSCRQRSLLLLPPSVLLLSPCGWAAGLPLDRVFLQS